MNRSISSGKRISIYTARTLKSIICGAGVVGKSIAESLSNEGLSVTVIDESTEAIKKNI